MTGLWSGETTTMKVTDRDATGPWVIVCEHASNHVPGEFSGLGLDPADLQRHIAWDPGAAPVARMLGHALGAVVVESTISRLVADANRPLDAPDLIWELSETTTIPGNVGLSAEERARRVELAWRPFHETLDAVIAERLAAGRETLIATIHSFTPVWKGTPRPWHVGVIHDEDERISAPLLAGLRGEAGIIVGDNEPYAPKDRVYYTVERHARARGLPGVMIEIRNDLIADHGGQADWAARLARHLGAATAARAGAALDGGRRYA